MWTHNYTPFSGNLTLSALFAAIPIFTLIVLLGILRKPAWIAALCGLGAAILTSMFLYGMPVPIVFAAVTYGAAQGLFPIGWVVFTAVLLYRITQETGKFEIIKDSIGSLSSDPRLQALLIAFAFGAFIEGASGFGTPIAVAAAMLTGLGFSPFYAAAICLLANTCPVAFGSIGIPITTLAQVTGLPEMRLSAGVGRICAPLSLFVPSYLIAVMGGMKALKGVLLATIVCGVSFATVQFVISNFVGVQLTDILASLAAMACLAMLFKVWKPKDRFAMAEGKSLAEQVTPPSHPAGEIFMAWLPYILLVIIVLVWGYNQTALRSVSKIINWPGLHNAVEIVPPVAKAPGPYAATYRFDWLSASGTACLIVSIVSAFLLGMSPGKLVSVFFRTVRQLALAELTIASVMGLAYLMNYSGATGTLGLGFAATGVLFPFFSAWLGWLGVFLTGSDTSANALFGNLQVVTANQLNMNPILMASSNSAGGVMGKMISLTSVAVASAATGMSRDDEGRLFRFTIRHSVTLATVIGLIVVFYAYVAPHLAP
jgi:L-lactate transport